MRKAWWMTWMLVVVMTAGAAIAWAQETPTEREAAREVLASMATMQKGLDVPGMVAKYTAPNPARDAVAARVDLRLQGGLRRCRTTT